MAYKVLYRKYRPDSFDTVVGQDYTVKMLKNAIETGKNSHAYIFTGPRGTGKTSSAKIFAKALNCEHPVDGNPCGKCESCKNFNENPDIIEIDAASNNGVDEIRELINNVKLVPSISKYKVYIIDEVHMLTASAFNALLLTLEEPPSHVVFILATTDIQNVPITILSRCQRFDFKPVNMDAMVDRLKFVCKKEKIKIEDEAINEIALISAGGMRDALGMLDQLSSDDSKITLDRVSSYFGSVSVKRVDELLDALGNNDAKLLLDIISDISKSGNNYAVFVKKLIEELRKYAIDIKLGNRDYGLYFEDIYSLIFDLNECLGNININVDPYSLIEIVLLKYISGNKKDSVKYSLGNNESSIDKSISIEEETPVIIEEKQVEEEKVEVKEEVKDTKKAVIHKKKISFDINRRINNCFAECTKEKKKEVSDHWVEFMNHLMKEDRSMVSLIADTSILAASDRTILIQSKIESTNNLINESILDIEKAYGNYFPGNNVKFAALDEKTWKAETEKYVINQKNKVKYTYIDEEELIIEDNQQSVDKKDSIESVAEEIFGTFEIE